MKAGKRRICNICRKDAVRNCYSLLLLGIINFIYILVHFVPGRHFERMLLSVQALYVLGIIVAIPFMLYARCGGENRQIIKQVVLPKIHFDNAYFDFYYMWVIAFVFGGALVSGGTICVFGKSSIENSVIFLVSVIVLVLSVIQIGVMIFDYFEKFVLGLMVYFLCMIILIVINAPDSYLWIICDYENANQMVQYWVGKITFLTTITTVNIINKYMYLFRFH